MKVLITIECHVEHRRKREMHFTQEISQLQLEEAVELESLYCDTVHV